MSSARIRASIVTLERVMHRLDLPGAPPAALEHVAALESHSAALAAMLAGVAGPALLEGRDLWQSLARAIVAIAREKRALRIGPADLKDLVENEAPAAHLKFWTTKAASGIQGLLRHQPEVRSLIEAEGVLYWDRHEDEALRLVDSRHLTAHADIRAWILAPPTGARCRFCGCDTNPEVDELHAVDEDYLGGVEVVNGRVRIPARGAIVHDQCRPYWREWVAVAARYASQEEAAAADATAGRRPKVQPRTALAVAGA